MRRIAIAAVTLAVVASTIALASPASAVANTNVSVDCVGGAAVFSPTSVTASAGDTITLTNATVNINWSISATGATPASGSLPTLGTVVLTMSSSGGGSVTATRQTGPGCTAATLTISAGGGGGGGGSSSGSATPSAPDPIVQQFGRPASGTCADTASESLNWGGASSGGWGESWAEWMHGGLGGAVCTRTLVYSTSSGAWTAS